MADALKKIRSRAKQLQKKHPGAKWTNLIKQASAQYRAGKLGKVAKPAKKKKDKSRQTGSSNKFYDEQRHARTPGPRKPAGGKKVTYYERRKNRSDKPGSMTGGLKQVVKQKLANALLKYEMAKTISATKEAQKQKTKWRKILRAL